MVVQLVKIQNQNFILHPSGSIFWKEKNILLIADLHLGKVSHFRKHGSAVPQEALYKNFEKLNAVISYFNPETILFLGDLFHSYINSEWQLFEKWVPKQVANIVLVIGNHDVISPSKYEALNIQLAQEVIIDDFLLTHHPETRDHYYNFSGHLHPGIRLKGLGKQFLKVSCFYRTPKQLILPAFGVFTGLYIVQPNPEDVIYVNSEDEVIEI